MVVRELDEDIHRATRIQHTAQRSIHSHVHPGLASRLGHVRTCGSLGFDGEVGAGADGLKDVTLNARRSADRAPPSPRGWPG